MADLPLTLFGTLAVTWMLAAYVLEPRNRWFVALFAAGCALSALYAWLAEAYPFAAIETIWTGVAWRRFTARSRREADPPAP